MGQHLDLPETQVVVCQRYPVNKLMKFDGDGNVVSAPGNVLPVKFLEALEHNQTLAHCCRHPENHELEALKSKPTETAPDIYKFYCNECGKVHTRFCIGSGDVRPYWEVR